MTTALMTSQGTREPLNWRYTELDDHDFQIRGRTLFFIVVLCSVILLITLLFLYARWICRYHRLTSSLVVSAFPTSHAPPAPPLPSMGLDPVSIKGLPITLYPSSSPPEVNRADVESSGECCICLSLFEDGEKVKILPNCGHCFHSDCVDKWLTSQSSCPLCRVSIRVDSASDSAALTQIVLE